MFVLYVLKSEKDQRLYIGSTADLSRRLREHEQGLVRSTKHRRPLMLIYTEEYSSRNEAAARERYFKSGGKARKLLDELMGV